MERLGVCRIVLESKSLYSVYVNVRAWVCACVLVCVCVCVCVVCEERETKKRCV